MEISKSIWSWNCPADDEEAKSDEYSSEMQSKMGGFLTYRHEDGMNFAQVLDDLIVGSCLQTPSDLDRFAWNLVFWVWEDAKSLDKTAWMQPL